MIVFFNRSECSENAAQFQKRDFFEKLNEYANLKLLERIEFAIEENEESDFISYSSLFPMFYLSRNGISVCMSRLKSLEMMVKSNLPYYTIPPSMVFILDCVLQYADERARDIRDDSGFELFEESKIKPKKGKELSDYEKRTNRIAELSMELQGIVSKQKDNDYKDLYEAIKCFEWDYVYALFDDGGDLTPEGLEILVALYARCGGFDDGVIEGINLNDCVDNMYEHTRLLFESVQREVERKRIIGFDSIDEFVVSSLQFCIMRLQTELTYIENDNEVRISARIADILAGCLYEKHIVVGREVPMGRATKEIGETDIVLTEYNGKIKKHFPIAIIENKVIEKFSSQYLQLMGYLNQDFSFGVTVSINRQMKLDEASSFIIDSLKEITGPFSVKSIKKCPGRIFTIKTTHIVPETKKEMEVYHLILNLNDCERKESALRARGIK